LKRLDRSIPLFEEALAREEKQLGSQHPTTLQTQGNLGVNYRDAGRLGEAIPLLEATLEKTKAKLGTNHPLTLNIMNSLAQAYQASGQLAKAVLLHEETLAKRRATLGPDHPDTLASMGRLGKAYAEAKQGEKAATTLVAYVDARRKQGSNPVAQGQFADLLAQVSLVLCGCGQYAAAEPLLRECLTIREKQEPDAWMTRNTESLLGGALLGQKKYAEAEPLLVKGYEGLITRENAPGADAARLAIQQRIPEALDRLIELYTATGKPDEAKKWQAERAKYPANQAPLPVEKK